MHLVFRYKRGRALGFSIIWNFSYLFFLTPFSLLSNYSLSFLVRISPKIARTSSILGQRPKKRYKEDRKTRKVEIERLEREEGSLEVLLSKEVLGGRIQREEPS